MTFSVAVSIVSSLVVDSFFPEWKTKILAALKAEREEGIIAKDLLLAVGICIISGLISMSMVYKEFGVGGWAGIAAANLVANFVA